jgi:uncharacterized RDD family membrane protein YckC
MSVERLVPRSRIRGAARRHLALLLSFVAFAALVWLAFLVLFPGPALRALVWMTTGL